MLPRSPLVSWRVCFWRCDWSMRWPTAFTGSSLNFAVFFSVFRLLKGSVHWLSTLYYVLRPEALCRSIQSLSRDAPTSLVIDVFCYGLPIVPANDALSSGIWIISSSLNTLQSHHQVYLADSLCVRSISPRP